MDKIDPRYKRGKVYCVRCRYDDDLCYVGSTIQTLAKRMATHRKDENCSLNQYVNEIDDEWCNWYIELYEYYPCNNKPELDKREGEITRQIGNINKVIAGRTQKEHYHDNRDKILEHANQYYQDNHNKCLERFKQYHQNNREKILEQFKQYHEDNREKISEYHKQKISCDHCGCLTTRHNIARHKRSQKCINFKPS